MKAAPSILAAATIAATACTSAPPSPPPVLSLVDRVCAKNLDLGSAKPVALAYEAPVVSEMDSLSPCWVMPDGSRSTYAVFVLPASSTSYVISIDSIPVGTALFSPKLLLLDAGGKLLRTVSREHGQFRGIALTLLTPYRRGERYAVVASEPASIGTASDHTENRFYSSVSAGVTINSATEAVVSITNAHNGRVAITLLAPSRGSTPSH